MRPVNQDQRNRVLLGLSLVLLFLFAPGWAQTSPQVDDATRRLLESKQREEQDRLRMEELRRMQENARPGTTLEAPEQAPAKPTSAVRLPIRELVIEGGKRLPEKVKTQLTRDFTGREIGLDDVEKLFSAIMKFYFDRGFGTTRVYLPEQDLTSGVLRVAVVEGRIEAFILREAGRADRVPPSNLFPASPGEVLNLRTLERGIDNLNRIPSNNAVLDLIPGAEAGATVVGIKNTVGRRWKAQASVDNSGSEDTGRYQGSATLTADNPLGLADSFMFNYRRSLTYNEERKGSQAFSGNYSLPWGYQSITAGASVSNYALTLNPTGVFPLLFDGDNQSFFLKVDRQLPAFQGTRNSVSANLTYKSSKNFLLGNLIDVSSRKMTVLDVDFSHSRAFAGGFLSLDPGLSFGLPFFGALEDADGLPDYAPHARFVKVKLNINYMRPFRWLDQEFSFTSALSAQYAMQVLYGSEQQTVSGQYAVRGFDKTSLAGDHGYYWRNDLSMIFSFAGPFGGRLGEKLQLRPFIGLDHGHAFSRIDNVPGLNPIEGGVAGATLGVGVTLQKLQAEATYSEALARPDEMESEDGRFLFRLLLSY